MASSISHSHPEDYHWIWQVASLELSAPGQCMALQASGYGDGREGCVHQLLKTVAEMTSEFSLEKLGFQISSSLPSAGPRSDQVAKGKLKALITRWTRCSEGQSWAPPVPRGAFPGAVLVFFGCFSFFQTS